MSWEEAIQGEQEWWGDCSNTSGEEGKHRRYAELMGLSSYRIPMEGHFGLAFDLEGKSILDVGGGPVSMLLKAKNRGRSVVVDPGGWPDWVLERYQAAGIEYIQKRAELVSPGELGTFDEVWIYNVLQHTGNPEHIAKMCLSHAPLVRVFEWVNVRADRLHPQVLTKEGLDRWFGTSGTVSEFDNGSAAPQAYYAVIGNHKMRFHLLGLAHLPTTREYSCCAYTQKIVKLAQMLRGLGHEVYFYGVEGSQVECNEFVPVLSEAERVAAYGVYDWKTQFFNEHGGEQALEIFNENAIREIKARQVAGDKLLCTMGLRHKPIADKVDILNCESGVGYPGIFSQFKAFESYAWMHYVYGLARQGDGTWYDAVIPNYFDLADFPYQPDKEEYALFIGRLVHRKGVDVAVQVTRDVGIPLIMAGQGSLQNPNEGLDIKDSHVTFLGAVGPEERAELMGRAKVVLVPTYYIEPFGGVAVEAQLCGTPVISTDWGAMSETVLHGVTGYRCRTLDDFVWAIRNIDSLDTKKVREWAESNYSMERVALMFQEWFTKLDSLQREGWYEIRQNRSALDWLLREYPKCSG